MLWPLGFQYADYSWVVTQFGAVAKGHDFSRAAKATK